MLPQAKLRLEKRLQAKFTPQAWVNDYAVDVDPEGPTTWDATEFFQNPPEDTDSLLRDMLAVIKKQGWCFDTDDLLKQDDNSPEWVRDWRGPFTITVTEVNEP